LQVELKYIKIKSREKNTVLVGSPDAASAVSNLPPKVVHSLIMLFLGGFLWTM